MPVSSQKSSLALIGARGAGKSKLSRKLGKATGRVVLAIDSLISYEAGGRSAAAIVEEEGWSGFRDREYEVLVRVCAMPDIIIDCGGGILVEAAQSPDQPESLSERKGQLLRKSATVIYVKRDLDWLLERAPLDHSRPDLGGEYRALLERRLPWYEEAADFVLDMRSL